MRSSRGDHPRPHPNRRFAPRRPGNRTVTAGRRTPASPAASLDRSPHLARALEAQSAQRSGAPLRPGAKVVDERRSDIKRDHPSEIEPPRYGDRPRRRRPDLHSNQHDSVDQGAQPRGKQGREGSTGERKCAGGRRTSMIATNITSSDVVTRGPSPRTRTRSNPRAPSRTPTGNWTNASINASPAARGSFSAIERRQRRHASSPATTWSRKAIVALGDNEVIAALPFHRRHAQGHLERRGDASEVVLVEG